MAKKVKFIVTTVWIILSRSYDAYCTYQLTPDLSKEGNPLVSVIGMTWTPLLITIGILTLYVIYTYYISIFKPIEMLPTEKGYNMGNILAYSYLGQKDHWLSVIYRVPENIKRFNHFMGHTLIRCLVFAGFVSTAMWLLINYTDFYKSIHSSALIYSILIIGCIIIIYFWNKSMYKQYLENMSTK